MLATVLVALLATLLVPGVAWAGGPTSVVLVSPQTEQTAGLYTGDPAYDRLLYLLGENPAAEPGPAPSGDWTAYVTVTWLVHDVSIWRIDRVFLDPSSGPWIVTRTASQTDGSVSADLDPGEQGGPTAAWHRPTDPAGMIDLFEGLGLLRTLPTAAMAVPAVAAPAPAAAGAGPGGQGDGRDSGWWWAGAGALLGAGVVLAGLRSSAALRRRLLPLPAEPLPAEPLAAERLVRERVTEEPGEPPVVDPAGSPHRVG